MLDELAKEMRFMSPDQVDDCAEYLSKRCESKSLVVKSKALRAIKTFCVRAPATFRQKMARHSVVVRACASHTGAPHPLRGDAPHKQVRDLANEAVRAIFDDVGRPLSRTNASANESRDPIEAGASIIGDASLGADGPRLRKTTGTWGGEERREGFGMRGVYASETSKNETAAAARGVLSSFSATAARVAEVPIGHGGDPTETDVAPTPTSSNAFLASAEVSTRATLAAESRARAPAFGDEETINRKALFRLEGSEEQRRVDAACARGGVKLAPTAEVLADFTRACESLRPEGVAAALAAKFAAARRVPESAPEATELRRDAFKAACCLEACARSAGEGARRVARPFCASSSPGNEEAESLRALAEGAGVGAALAEKASAAAAAAAAACGGGDATSVSAAATRNRATSSDVDFFGLEGLSTGTATGASRPPAGGPAVAPAVDDLLGGLSLGGGAPPPPQQQTLTPQQMLTQQQTLTPQQMLTQQQAFTQQQVFTQQQMLTQHRHAAQQQMLMSHVPNAASSAPFPPGPSLSPPSAGAARAPAALGGGPSAHARRKEAKAFDFVSDLLGSGKKK